MIAYFFSAVLAVFLMYGLPVVIVVSYRWMRAGGHRAAMTRLRAVSPDECPASGSGTSWHQQGCGLLDRLDAGATA